MQAIETTYKSPQASTPMILYDYVKRITPNHDAEHQKHYVTCCLLCYFVG
jgi:hypothetical protein